MTPRHSSDSKFQAPREQRRVGDEFHGWLPLTVVLVAVGAFAALMINAIRSNPNVIMLLPSGDAQWITTPTPPTLVAHMRELRTTAFRTTFSVAETADAVTMDVAALRAAVIVDIDDVRVHQEAYNQEDWKRTREIKVPFDLDAGTHTVTVFVSNEMGPPAVRVDAPGIGLATGPTWMSTDDGRTWKNASLVTEIAVPEITQAFPTPLRRLLETSPLWLAVCAIAGAIAWRGAAEGSRAAQLLAKVTPDRLRYALHGVLLVYGLNAMSTGNMHLGADSPDHYEYVHWFAEHLALPRVEDGAQFFQAPLYYAVAGGLHRLLAPIMDHDVLDRGLRILSVLSGLVIFECLFRLVRSAFPLNLTLQRIGLVLGAGTPLLLYKTQFVGNEAMAGALAACAVVAVMRVARPGAPAHPLAFAGAGLLWGLAVLSKVSALVLGPPFALAMVVWAWRSRVRFAVAAPRMALIAAVFVLVCGWFFAMNYARYDRPIIGGWDPEIGYEWWQPPAYRTPEQYLKFGDALERPVFASYFGFWDGVYSGLWFDNELSGVPNLANHPKWNYPFALCVLLWALIPTIAAIVGGLRVLVPSRQESALDPPDWLIREISLYVTGAYVASLLWHSLTLPYYNAIKASYALAALPCFVVLILAGLEPALRSRLARALAVAWLAGWVLFVGAGYWMRAP